MTYCDSTFLLPHPQAQPMADGKWHSALPGGSVVKNPPADAGDSGSVSGSRRSPGEGNGNPLQYSCLEIPWTEEPGRLQSMGHRVRPDLATEQQQIVLTVLLAEATAVQPANSRIHCGPWASTGFGIHSRSWPQSPTDTEGHTV